MGKAVHKVFNKDGSVDIYESDGVNPPTKNGKPIIIKPPKRPTFNLKNKKLTIRYSSPITTVANKRNSSET